jgi:hypothetical protein
LRGCLPASTRTNNAAGRLSSVTTGASAASPTTRHAHNALGQRVFTAEPVYPSADSENADDTSLAAFFNPAVAMALLGLRRRPPHVANKHCAAVLAAEGASAPLEYLFLQQ